MSHESTQTYHDQDAVGVLAVLGIDTNWGELEKLAEVSTPDGVRPEGWVVSLTWTESCQAADPLVTLDVVYRELAGPGLTLAEYESVVLCGAGGV